MAARTTLALIALAVATSVDAADPIDLPTFVAISRPAPTLQLRYGSAPPQAIDVFLPAGSGPHPVAVLIHGGCWTAHTAGREQLRHLGAELARHRKSRSGALDTDAPTSRVGAIQAPSRTLATPSIGYVLKRPNIIWTSRGRSWSVTLRAGGHLAAWAAARGQLPAGSQLYHPRPCPACGHQSCRHRRSPRRSPPLFR